MAAPLESSVVRIYSKSGKVIGAGFLVSSKQVLTCAHVVTDALGIPRTTQEQPDGVINLDFPLLAAKQKLVAKVIFWQPVNPNEVFEDIAGLELETALPDTAQPAQLVTSEDLWGHPFRVLGFPAGQPNGVSASGVLRSRIANGWVQLEDVKQAGYRLEPGFSGAPVWDEELQGVAGMAVAAEMNRVDVKAAFIIPTSILVNAWSDLGEQAIPSCPYRGLFAFREQDVKFFFGREKFTEQLVAAVQRQQLVVVIGSSGSGKSSVVFAGLVPQLRQQGDWLINSFRPGERPLRNLAAALVPLLETQMSETDQLGEINKLAMAFGEGNITLQEVVTRILEKHSSTRLLLVADQFEELYTLCKDGLECQLFLDRLLEGLNKEPNFHLVLTLRADFLGYALSYRSFADALQNADVKLGPMNRQELQDAIAKPAQMLGVRIEEGLTERILEAVENSPGNLPLLEFALTQLWAKQRNGQLTHDAYEEIGGVEKALASYAEEVYRRLSEVDRHVVQRVFIQLVRPGEGTEDTRRLATRAEVGEDNWDLVTRLADVRLVVTGQDEGVGEETVEIVHEALLREWGRLRGWMESDRSFRTWQERLRAARRQWEATGNDDGALLRGAPLAEAEDWQQRRLGELSPEERVFIQLSLALRDREQAEREQQQQRELLLERQARRWLQGLVAVLGTIALGTTGVLAYPHVLRWKAASLGEMVIVPAGDAVIGTNDPQADDYEKPQWYTYLPAFKIERFEVSNRQYGLCIAAGACTPPIGSSRFYDKSALNHPITGITAVQAAAYCRWLNRRLPTELEWEWAARGSDKRRLWPWGKQTPTPMHANILFGDVRKGTELVNSHSNAVSPEGVYNLVGNVWEWTASYIYNYNEPNQKRVWNGRPETLLSDVGLVQRGGGWEDSMIRITFRKAPVGSRTRPSVGMRCASSL
jgi:formylglycine-generating enzyme required for sulfatase activity